MFCFILSKSTSLTSELMLLRLNYRCSIRQADILATTLEPVRHRDYTAAANHYYPTTPLKTLHDDKKGRKKKKKVTRKKSRRDGSETSRSLNLDGTLAGADTPESVIDSSREEDVRRGHKEIRKKLGSKRHLSMIEQESSSTVTGQLDDMSDYAESMASKILQESIPKTCEPTDLYAGDLASSIMNQALETVDLYLHHKEKSMFEKSRLPADNKNMDAKQLKGIYPSTPRNERTDTDITENEVDMSVLDKYKK